MRLKIKVLHIIPELRQSSTPDQHDIHEALTAILHEFFPTTTTYEYLVNACLGSFGIILEEQLFCTMARWQAID